MRTMMRVALVVMVGLVACGDGGSDDTPLSPRALADKIGCTEFEAQTGQIELGAREEAWCLLDDERLTILTYKSNGPRDEAQKLADQFGGGIAVLGDRFTVRVDTQETAEKVKAAVGGSIR